MQMRKIYCFRSFALDSAHEKFDVWTGPKGSYTDDQLMNYKNLDCYQNFANEWVPKGGPRSHAISLFVEGSIELEKLLVSYDVLPLFTNVPLDETIQLLANGTFTNNWFSTTYDLNLIKTDLVDLLSVATKGQFFQFNLNCFTFYNLRTLLS